MKKLIAVLGLLVLVGAISPAAVYAVTVVDVAEDTYSDGWTPGDAMGALYPGSIVTGIYEEGRTRLGVVKFNLPTLTVTDAKLSLYISSVWGAAGDSSYIVEQIANTWNENTANGYDIWNLVVGGWADGIALDSQVINGSVAGTWVEWDVTSAVLAAGPGGTVSFYTGIDHYMPMVANAWSFNSKEGDESLATSAKLLLTPVPEPSSLMALSAGLFGGLCALARGRR